jgi:hypothetical protein
MAACSSSGRSLKSTSHGSGAASVATISVRPFEGLLLLVAATGCRRGLHQLGRPVRPVDPGGTTLGDGFLSSGSGWVGRLLVQLGPAVVTLMGKRLGCRWSRRRDRDHLLSSSELLVHAHEVATCLRQLRRWRQAHRRQGRLPRPAGQDPASCSGDRTNRIGVYSSIRGGVWRLHSRHYKTVLDKSQPVW